MKSTILHVLVASLVVVPGVGAQEATCISEFVAGPVFEIGENMGTSAVGDFNQDGKADLSVGFRLFLGDGAGGFDATPVELQGPFPLAFDIKIADFDGDGLEDLATAGFQDSSIAFFFARDPADSLFLYDAAEVVPLAPVSRGVWHIEVGDFNNDELPDLVGISFFADGGPRLDVVGDGGGNVILLNQGQRSFEVLPLPSGPVNHMLTTADFDGDGNDDVAFGAGSDVTLLFGQGDGTFPEQVSGALRNNFQGVNGHRFRSADFDGDGRSELVATGDRVVLVYRGATLQPDSKFPAEAHRVLDMSGSVRFIEIADVNFDGVLDIATVSNAGRDSVAQVYFGQATEDDVTFVAGSVDHTGLSGHGSVLALGDLNGDRFTDLVVTTEDRQTAKVLLNRANCGARPLPGDANHDGLLDVSDAIAILLHLFSGDALPCPAVANTNGDEILDISDAIHLLTFLFLGGPDPVDSGASTCSQELPE